MPSSRPVKHQGVWYPSHRELARAEGISASRIDNLVKQFGDDLDKMPRKFETLYLVGGYDQCEGFLFWNANKSVHISAILFDDDGSEGISLWIGDEERDYVLKDNVYLYFKKFVDDIEEVAKGWGFNIEWKNYLETRDMRWGFQLDPQCDEEAEEEETAEKRKDIKKETIVTENGDSKIEPTENKNNCSNDTEELSNYELLLRIIGGLNFPRGRAVACLSQTGMKDGESELEKLKEAALLIKFEIDRLSR